MAEKTALQIAQEFCRRQGLPQPDTLVGSRDDTVQQILGLMNEGISDLVDRYEWQQCRHGMSFTHGDLGSYIAIDFDASTVGFSYIIPRTLWDTTSKVEVVGPLSDMEWRQLTALGASGALYHYSMLGNNLRIYPVPSPTTSVNFQLNWYGKYGVAPPTGSNQLESYTDDECRPLLPTRIVLQDLKWRWRKEKGLPYAEDQRALEQMAVSAVGHEAGAFLVLDHCSIDARPGIVVPAGSWNIP